MKEERMDKDNVFIYMFLLLVLSSPDGFAGKFEFVLIIKTGWILKKVIRTLP